VHFSALVRTVEMRENPRQIWSSTLRALSALCISDLGYYGHRPVQKPHFN